MIPVCSWVHVHTSQRQSTVAILGWWRRWLDAVRTLVDVAQRRLLVMTNKLMRMGQMKIGWTDGLVVPGWDERLVSAVDRTLDSDRGAGVTGRVARRWSIVDGRRHVVVVTVLRLRPRHVLHDQRRRRGRATVTGRGGRTVPWALEGRRRRTAVMTWDHGAARRTDCVLHHHHTHNITPCIQDTTASLSQELNEQHQSCRSAINSTTVTQHVGYTQNTAPRVPHRNTCLGFKWISRKCWIRPTGRIDEGAKVRPVTRRSRLLVVQRCFATQNAALKRPIAAAWLDLSISRHIISHNQPHPTCEPQSVFTAGQQTQSRHHRVDRPHRRLAGKHIHVMERRYKLTQQAASNTNTF